MPTLQDVKRRANFILTGLGVRRKGFFTPYDYLRTVSWDVMPYPALAADFELRKPLFRDFLKLVDANESRFLAMQGKPHAPDWSSRFISPLDGAVIYTGIGSFRPGRVIEVGSGNSTHFICQAIADHGLKVEVTCIDPAPRTSIAALPVQVMPRMLSPADLDLIASLEAGDVLFIDSSHLLQQGFDVDILFNRAFPLLSPGVIVHVHDIFLPYGYPSAWQAYRFTEQMALACLLHAGFFETLFASHFVWRDMRDDLRMICPRFPLDTPDNGGSVWLRKR